MQENNSKNLLEYMQWGDNTIFKLVSELTEEQINEDFGRNMRSIRDRLYHLAEDHLGWYCEVTGNDWRQPYEELQTKNPSELIASVQQFHKKWLDLVANPSETEFKFNEENGIVVPMSLDEVAFNLANHASYHRGQLMTLLRAQNKEAVITDYKFYKISQIKK